MSESNMVGTWGLIGYKMANTTNFSYDSTGVSAATSISALNNNKGWEATNNVAMNDCAAGTSKCYWTIKLSSSGNGDGVTYAATAGTASGSSVDAAKQLTPTFEKLGK